MTSHLQIFQHESTLTLTSKIHFGFMEVKQCKTLGDRYANNILANGGFVQPFFHVYAHSVRTFVKNGKTWVVEKQTCHSQALLLSERQDIFKLSLNV